MISIIIPYFNAKEYIVDSVISLSDFSIISEIIVVYDGCSKTKFKELEKLICFENKIKILSHPGLKNMGVSASRNLGIREAKNLWIAFLDADDYFLPNRFNEFNRLLNSSLDFDGLYEHVQYSNGSNKIYGVKKKILPEKLFHYLIRGTYGHFHTNGLIVKKDLLLSVGLFNEKLRLHQDSELWLKLAFYGRLVSGDLSSPVSMVRVHKDNRIWAGTSNSSRLKQWKVTWSWAWNKPVGFINKLLILRKIFKYSVGCLK